MTDRQDKTKAPVVPLRKPRPCPICGRKSQAQWHPFCSRRCADIDLHRWLSGQYVITGGDDESAFSTGEEAQD